MKLSTIGLAGVVLVALAACNTEQAANNSAENTIEATNSAAATENVATGDKPADEATAGDQTSTGDKPADAAADTPAGDPADGDKPVE